MAEAQRQIVVRGPAMIRNKTVSDPEHIKLIELLSDARAQLAAATADRARLARAILGLCERRDQQNRACRSCRDLAEPFLPSDHAPAVQGGAPIAATTMEGE